MKYQAANTTPPKTLANCCKIKVVLYKELEELVLGVAAGAAEELAFADPEVAEAAAELAAVADEVVAPPEELDEAGGATLDEAASEEEEEEDVDGASEDEELEEDEAFTAPIVPPTGPPDGVSLIPDVPSAAF